MKKQNWTHGCHHLPEQEEPQPPDPVPILPGGGLSTDLAEVEYKLKQVGYFSGNQGMLHCPNVVQKHYSNPSVEKHY